MAPGGGVSCAHWLSWRVGMDLGTAREKVRVARKLVELPLIDEALARGQISYSKVRAMTRVATVANEEDLLSMARNATGAQLEKICRLKRGVDKLGVERTAEEECRRYVMERATDDGMVSIQLRLRPEEAASVMKAFEACAEGGSLADGAVAIAEAALRGGSEGVVRPPVEVVVHVSAESLQGQTGLGDGISAEGCRRLLCDCGVVPMLENARGKTIDVGRKTRTIPAALRRALAARDGGCRFPGCTTRRFVDGHHILHWIDGGETSLENTVLLCRRHHRYLHEAGFSLERVGEDLVFSDGQGRVIPRQGGRPDLRVDVAELVGSWPAAPITSETNAPGWDGERVHYGLCVAALG